MLTASVADVGHRYIYWEKAVQQAQSGSRWRVDDGI